MMRIGRIAFVVLAVIGAAPAVASGWPVPPVARPFLSALERGDLARARTMLGPSPDIISSARNTGTPADLAEVQSYVRGCHASHLGASRALWDVENRFVDADWSCADGRRVELSLTISAGRVAGIQFGGPFPLVIPPEMVNRVDLVAGDFLDPLIAANDIEEARRMLAPDAVLRDNRDGRTMRLAALAAQLRPCRMPGIEVRGADVALSRWICPAGELVVTIERKGHSITRVELGNSAGEGRR